MEKIRTEYKKISRNLIKMYSSNENLIAPLKINTYIRALSFVLIFLAPLILSQFASKYDFWLISFIIEIFLITAGTSLLVYFDHRTLIKTGLAPAIFLILAPIIHIIILMVPGIGDNSLIPQLVSWLVIIIYLFTLYSKEYFGSIKLLFESQKKIIWLLIIFIIALILYFIFEFINPEIVNALKKTLPSKIQGYMSGTTQNEESLRSSLVNPGSYISFFMLTVLAAPVIEEIVYRKGIFDIIKNKKIALIFSSIIFGAMHINVSEAQGWYEYINIFYYFSAGLVLATVYYFTENFATTWLLHLTFNLIAFVSMFT